VSEARGPETGALAALRAACARAPDSAVAWFNLGDALERDGGAGSLAEAADAYRRAIDADRDFAPPHDRLGQLLLRNGDPAGAAAAFEELSHVQPRFPGVFLSWGRALAAAGDVEGAMARYRKCAQVDAEREVPALTAWARLLRERGDLAGARGRLAEALHEDPYYFLAHAEEGMCLLAAGEREAGIERLGRALEMIDFAKDASSERAWIEEALRAARGV